MGEHRLDCNIRLRGGRMSEKPTIRSKPEAAQKQKPEAQKQKIEVEKGIARLRALAHDFSNSLEAIMQASYLLGQVKLEGESKRWAQLLEASSDEAARINREIRKLRGPMSGARGG